MPKHDYNLIVIGAGSAGLVASYMAAAVQAKVVLIEKNEMGGDCLNTGCVPSKALLHAAKVAADMRKAKADGWIDHAGTVDFSKVMQHVHHAIASIAPHDSVQRYTGLGVECIKGHATLTGPHSVEVNGQTLTARSIILATGAEPLVPPIPGLETINYLTSDTLWNLQTLPQRLTILGGGPIGVEMAQAFARLGSEVTLVDRNPHLLHKEDVGVSDVIQEALQKDGVRVLTSHKARSVREGELTCEASGNTITLPFDTLLVALGRKPRVTGYGLENIGLKLAKRGTIETNAFLQTNIPSIYVCGDATGPYQFTHFAGHQGWQAALNALLRPLWKFKPNNDLIPWVTYTQPEVAHIGLNEQMAKRQGVAYEKTLYPMQSSDRAIAEGQTEGFIQILTKPGSDRILGATLVTSHAGELLTPFLLAMQHGMGLKKLAAPVYPYPSWGEAVKNAANQWRKEHSPGWALPWLKRFHALRR